MRTRIHVILLALPLLALAAACGSDEESAFPTGTYQSVAVLDNVMVFNDDGTYRVNEGPLLVVGTYSTKGDQLKTLTDSFCTDTPESTYTWSWDGTTLGMKPTQDNCDARSTAWSSGLTPTFPRVGYVPADSPGDGILMLNPDGSFQLTDSTGDLVTEGTYQVRGDTFTWLTDSYCKELGAEQGSYTWAWDGTALTMGLVQDECGDRVTVATARKLPAPATPSTSG